MSFTKQAYEVNIIQNVNKNNQETLKNNDITPLLDMIDHTIHILDEVKKNDEDIGGLWNEITSDVIASINSATSGFYRQAIITLRSILELGCTSFYYLDHKIEFHLFKVHDFKADKYVNTLINDYQFFTTKYIDSFYSDIKTVQTSENSVSKKLNSLYKQLSDTVHGRYKTLTKQNELSICYNKQWLNYFKDKLIDVVGILATMYVLRVNDNETDEIINLVNKIGVVRI